MYIVGLAFVIKIEYNVWGLWEARGKREGLLCMFLGVLKTLCKKSTFPEDTENLRQLIYQQYQQQQELKDNIFKLLIHLKKKQRALQTQTGLF